MTSNGEKTTNRRGHKAMVTGAATFVLGLILSIAGNGTGMTGVGILLATAGLVTWIVGIGLRRER